MTACVYALNSEPLIAVMSNLQRLNGQSVFAMQLLGADQQQAEAQNQAIYQLIQEYGQGLTSTDARLALEYYWQAAAVVGGDAEVKVWPSSLLSHFVMQSAHVAFTDLSFCTQHLGMVTQLELLADSLV